VRSQVCKRWNSPKDRGKNSTCLIVEGKSSHQQMLSLTPLMLFDLEVVVPSHRVGFVCSFTVISDLGDLARTALRTERSTAAFSSKAPFQLTVEFH
jgi:hypothetical protein